MENSSGGAAILTGIHTAFKFADIAVRIAEVGTENEVFVRTIHIVREDLTEVERLLSDDSIGLRLAGIHGRLSWVRGAIDSANVALNDIGKWVERARVDQESTGSVRFETRVRWIFNDREKLLNRKSELHACHQQLSTVLTYLLRIEDVAPTPVPPAYSDTILFNDILPPRQRRIHMATTQKRQVAAFEGNGPRPSEVAIYPPPFPHSPPPAYASANVSDQPLEPPGQRDTVKEDPENPDSLYFPTNTGEQFAYKAYQPAELEGSAPQLSATNALGPVNPFELMGCLPTLKEARNTQSQATVAERAIPELPGDVSFPAELHAGTDPVRGYPPCRHSQPAVEIPTSRIPTQTERIQSWDGISGLHTIPRRPLPDNSIYFNDQSMQPWNHHNNNMSSTRLDAVNTSPQAHSYRLTPTLYSQSTLHSQSSVSLISSISSPRPNSCISSPISGRTWSDSVVSQEMSSGVREPTYADRSSMLQPSPNPTQSGRMRSQKNFMEMLRSIPDRDGL